MGNEPELRSRLKTSLNALSKRVDVVKKALSQIPTPQPNTEIPTPVDNPVDTPEVPAVPIHEPGTRQAPVKDPPPHSSTPK
jgi:hypothetical protein